MACDSIKLQFRTSRCEARSSSGLYHTLIREAFPTVLYPSLFYLSLSLLLGPTSVLNLFRPLSEWFSGKVSPTADNDNASSLPADAPVPIIWMFGKTGSGKSSVIATITGAEEAEIGGGFRPTTRLNREFAFPTTETPLVRFMDTRGIGEANLASESDEASSPDWLPSGKQADLVLVTIRVTDHSLDELVASLKLIRGQSPSRPILLALTSLHDAYAGKPHPSSEILETLADLEIAQSDARLPGSLSRSLTAQLDRFAGLVDHTVAIDLTKPEDGFDPCDLGADRLFEAVLDHLPAAMRQTLATMDLVKDELRTSHAKSVESVILTHAAIAAGAAAVPLAWVDMPVVLGTQTHMAHRIAKLHGTTFDKTAMARLSAVLGGRMAMRMLVRGVAKAVPVLGSAVNSASAFAMTYAAGKVCHWYFEKVSLGHVPSEAEIANVYREQIAMGRDYWSRRRESESSS